MVTRSSLSTSGFERVVTSPRFMPKLDIHVNFLIQLIDYQGRPTIEMISSFSLTPLTACTVDAEHYLKAERSVGSTVQVAEKRTEEEKIWLWLWLQPMFSPLTLKQTNNRDC
ncbi:hypothetical protein MTR67_042676 [Solanum verrucosum]|uniref:Uncharacterized protein n=1 Tax=Solanum verrucosum TaxID=315347 RepID=A0AAF0ZRZ2_SOLVR|nr:hypothetical protein MTR67_042676 [Solanum verrucosum]